MTSLARRRSWGEPRVRIFLSSAVILLVIALAFIGLQYRHFSRDRDLIQRGTRIDKAHIRAVDGITRQGYTAVLDHPPIADLIYEWQGKNVNATLPLDAQRERARVGETIPIYVDNPEHPVVISDHVTAGWFEDLFIGIILLPFGVVALIVAVIRRGQVLKIWRTGQASQAIVVESRHSAAHPRSAIVRLALTQRDRRLITAVVPHKALRLEPGDTLWLIAPPQRPQKAIVAQLYE